MKNFKISIAMLAMFAMVFTSCSKDETGPEMDSDKVTLSFGAILNDLVTNRASSKQSLSDLPSCSSDAPAYVSIVLSLDGVDVVGSDVDPFEIDLVDGQLFTEEVAELQLSADTYSLEHFAVYNASNQVIWVAPRTGSELSGWINNPLPLSIDLRNGVKKYVEVPVLCFDNRDVNEYGYLFFELDATQAVEFCFFANYCPPNGRHYTANYSVSIWHGTDSSGTPIYTDRTVTTGQYDNGDYFADPFCVALPANDDVNEEYLYYEVTLLDWPANYGSVTTTVAYGTLSMQDIMNNFDGANNVDYQHLRFGCEGEGGVPIGSGPGGETPGNGGGTPGNGGGTPGNGGGTPGDGGGNGDDCETAFMKGDTRLNDLGYPGNNWGWAENFSNEGDGEYTYEIWAGAGQNDTSNGDLVGYATLTASGDEYTLVVEYFDGVEVNDFHVYIGDDAPDSRAPGQFDNQDDSMTYQRTDADGNFFFIVHAEVCYDDDSED